MAKEKDSGIRWDSPVVIYGGLALIVLVFGRKIVSHLAGILSSIPFFEGPANTLERTDDPLTESRTGVLTASIMDPPNNGAGSRAGTGSNLRVKLAINSPDVKLLEVVVRVTWYFRLFGGKSATQTSKVIEAPAGRSTYDVQVPIPFFVSTVDGVAEVFIDGRSLAVPSLFQLE